MLHDDATYTMMELSQLIVDFFELGDDVAETLCFRYVTHVGEERRRVYRTLLENETIENKVFIDEEGNQQQLTINCAELSCFLPQGTIVEQEVNCDSAFKLQTLPPIAAEIHEKMPWIPIEQPIYLVMDNAGGHGTRAAREEYTRRLRDEYNIIILQQSACSPEVNALDLGIWMSVQAAVEVRHRNRRRDPDGLAATVKEAWENLPGETIQRVFNRILDVLQQIVASGGDNITVEDNRGRRNMDAADQE